MQGLADGYFVAPYTVGDHLATSKLPAVTTDHPAFKEVVALAESRTKQLLNIKGRRSVDSFHRELGHIMWDKCGMSRDAAGLREAIDKIRGLKAEFWRNVRVLGHGNELNQSLEYAGRVGDFLEFGELLATDALARNESCGGHFREEYQEEGEALRDDDNFCHVAAWEFTGEQAAPVRHQEPLQFNEVHLTKRSYRE
jgi:succinate dehydrogenase / fumarate reductase flavoprotein subunit